MPKSIIFCKICFKKTASISALLFFAIFLVILSSAAIAEDSITIRRSSVDLSSGRTTDQLVLDIYLDQPEEFYISISAPSHDGGGDENYFYMRPISGKGMNKQVKLALDLPFQQLTPGGAYQVNTMNSVVNRRNPPRLASNNYSSCRESVNPYAGSRVCKPLSFLILDMESVPGATYGTDLDIEITTKNQQRVLRETVYVTYTNTNSPIGIHSTKDRLSLKPDNAFKDSSLFCIFSQAEGNFDVRLEGEMKGEQFILRGDDHHYLPYNTKIFLNNHKRPENVNPFEWARGGETIKARNVWGCGGQNNLEVQVSVLPEVISKTKPGHYSGVLTVRVRAQ